MPADLTTEDQLVTDIVAYFAAHPPVSLPVVDFRSNAERPLPCVIIGHDGAEREHARGMYGTGRVKLSAVIQSDLDATVPTAHRAYTGAIDAAIMALKDAQVLALSYVHAVLPEGAANHIDDRREYTSQSYTIVATRCSS